jgi:hypothetical protein
LHSGTSTTVSALAQAGVNASCFFNMLGMKKIDIAGIDSA